MVKCSPEQAREIVALDEALESIAALRIHVDRRGGGDPAVLQIAAVGSMGEVHELPRPAKVQRGGARPILDALEDWLVSRLQDLGARR